MTTTEFPAAGPTAGLNSQIALRANPLVLRNSRFLCWLTRGGSVLVGFFSVCMLIVFFTNLKGGGFLNVFWWLVGALSFAVGAARCWELGRDMLHYQIQFDARGVSFNLGTKKHPDELFLPWDEIAAVKRRRAGNVQRFWVEGKDGSEASFSSFTFFRPRKIARLIAARAGLAIEKI